MEKTPFFKLQNQTGHLLKGIPWSFIYKMTFSFELPAASQS